MITVSVPSFGRRNPVRQSYSPAAEDAGPESLRELMDAGSPITEDIVNELRNACLARLDSNAVMTMPAERLIMEGIERASKHDL